MSDEVDVPQAAMESLKLGIGLSRKCWANDKIINSLEREIEQSVYMVATGSRCLDLRNIVASYKIISALERMGDMAVDLRKSPSESGRSFVKR
jgi:phosphate transport system protein